MENYRVTLQSVEELFDVAMRHVDERRENMFDKKWAGVKDERELKRLAIDGWADEAARAMDIATSAVDTVQQDHNLPSFRPLWDVSGCEVDVARYLSGEPENMIDYEPVAVPRAGRVIVLCASVSVSGSISAENVKKRGHGIAALAFALSSMGLTVELWADMSSKSTGGSIDSTRVLVKGANDELDPARIMFAYAHPAMLRSLLLTSMHAWPGDRRRMNGVKRNGGYAGNGIADPIEDLPEGAIYLPPLIGYHDVDDPTEVLTGHLRLLGLLDD